MAVIKIKEKGVCVRLRKPKVVACIVLYYDTAISSLLQFKAHTKAGGGT